MLCPEIKAGNEGVRQRILWYRNLHSILYVVSFFKSFKLLLTSQIQAHRPIIADKEACSIHYAYFYLLHVLFWGSISFNTSTDLIRCNSSILIWCEWMTFYANTNKIKSESKDVIYFCNVGYRQSTAYDNN